VKPVVLVGHRPSLRLTVRLSGATTLVVILRDSKGRKLASWTKHTIRGAHGLILVLPPKARHAGKDRLQLTWPSGHSKTFAVAVKKTAGSVEPRHT
jgi:hypothetical protein